LEREKRREAWKRRYSTTGAAFLEKKINPLVKENVSKTVLWAQAHSDGRVH
jgi:hypothetical protein